MKIVFVETPCPWLVRKHAQIALGPIYLSTILRNSGHFVRIIRLQTIEECDTLNDFDVVAFGGTTLEYSMVEECAKRVRNFKHISIWYGGPHATALNKELKDNSLFDSIGVGSAEGYILDMVKDLTNGRLKKVYEPIDIDIDSIPLPDRSLIEGPHGGDIFSFYKNYNGTGNESVITSRGCNFNCAFCYSKAIWKKIQFRNVDSVISEITGIVEKLGVRQIRFCDDNLSANPDRLIILCNKLKPLEVFWRCSIRADQLTEQSCKIMFDSGCREISPGIESGDIRVLKFLNKKTNLQKIKDGCKIATDSGLNVRGLFMVGTPGEHQDTPEITMKFIDNLECHSLTLSTFIPLPGTPIWNNPTKFNCTILTKDFSLYNKDYWILKNGTKEKRNYIPLIRNHFLTEEEQKSNVERLELYFNNSGRMNLG